MKELKRHGVRDLYTRPCRTLTYKGIHNFEIWHFESFNIDYRLLSTNNFIITNNTDPSLETDNNEVIDLFYVSREIIADLYAKLMSQIRVHITDTSKLYTEILIIFLVFLGLLMLYLFTKIIYPLGNKLKSNIVTTIRLLNMIPVSVISQIKSIREYLTEISSKN